MAEQDSAPSMSPTAKIRDLEGLIVEVESLSAYHRLELRQLEAQQKGIQFVLDALNQATPT